MPGDGLAREGIGRPGRARAIARSSCVLPFLIPGRPPGSACFSSPASFARPRLPERTSRTRADSDWTKATHRATVPPRLGMCWLVLVPHPLPSVPTILRSIYTPRYPDGTRALLARLRRARRLAGVAAPPMPDVASLGALCASGTSAAASSGSCPTAVTTTSTVRTSRVHPSKPSTPADPNSYSRMWVPAEDRDKWLDIVGPENPRPSRRLTANSPSRENHSAPHAGTAKKPWSSTTAAPGGPRLTPPACIPSMKSPSASSRSPNSGSSASASHPSNVRQRPPCTAVRSGASAPVPATPRQSTGMPAHDERRGGHLAPTPPATSASSRTN